MTDRDGYMLKHDGLPSFRFRRCSLSTLPVGETGCGRNERSRMVGDVWKRFADRNHFGPHFTQFLDSAYHNHSDDKFDREAKSSDSDDDEYSQRNEDVHLSFIEKKACENSLGDFHTNVLREEQKEMSEERSQKILAQQDLTQDDFHHEGSPPSLADDDSNWTNTYEFDELDQEGEDSSEFMEGFSCRSTKNIYSCDEEASQERPFHADIAGGEEGSSHFSTCSSVAARSCPTLPSVHFDHAVATLVSIFSSPWTAELLGDVLRQCGGNITGAIEAILAHGDGDPHELIQQHEQKFSADDGLEERVFRTNLSSAGERGIANGKISATAASERSSRNLASKQPHSIVDCVDGPCDVPDEIFSDQQKGAKSVSLLSFSLAEEQFFDQETSEIKKKEQRCCRTDASRPIRRGKILPIEDDSFSRILVSDEWAPKFQFSEVIPVREERL